MKTEICDRCTPGCKCLPDVCMKAFCQECRNPCRCKHEGRAIVNRIKPEWQQKVGRLFSKVWDVPWFIILGVAFWALMFYVGYGVMKAIAEDMATVPHGKSIMAMFAILVLALCYGGKSKS